jgi:uracil-DNA glycosylase
MNYHKSWQELFNKYKINLDNIYNCVSNNIIFPKKEDVFTVFMMDINEIKVVLLGQDPYHNDNQANGLSFSVNNNIKIPPSLNNIFKELLIEFPERKYNFTHGNLERWFNEEKIFLLNCSLTVEKNKPNSHYKLWKDFTDNVIKFISDNNKNCCFLLLGNFAKSKSILINNKNMIINGIHPSPLSAHNGFFNSNIFKMVEDKIRTKINWQN